MKLKYFTSTHTKPLGFVHLRGKHL